MATQKKRSFRAPSLNAFEDFGQKQVQSLDERKNAHKPMKSVHAFASFGKPRVQSLQERQQTEDEQRNNPRAPNLKDIRDLESSIKEESQSRFSERFYRYLRYMDGTMPMYAAFWRSKGTFLNIVFNAIPRGVGQVVFMNNPICGIIIMIALWITNPIMMSFGYLGIFISNYMAIFMGFSDSLVDSGIYGYNGVLIGLALNVFLTWPPIDGNTYFIYIFLIILTSSFTTILNEALGHLMIPTWQIPPLTFSFSITLILSLLTARKFSRFPLISSEIPLDYLIQSTETEVYNGQMISHSDWEWGNFQSSFPSFTDLMSSTLSGVAQVYLSDNIWVGLSVLISMVFSSRISPICAFFGCLVGNLTGIFLGAPNSQIKAGLWGYPGCLSAIAIGGIFFVPGKKTTLVALYCSAISTLIHAGLIAFFSSYGVPSASLGFTFGTTFFTLLQRSASSVVPVSLQAVTTPESHLKKFREVEILEKKQRELQEKNLEMEKKKNFQMEKNYSIGTFDQSLASMDPIKESNT